MKNLKVKISVMLCLIFCFTLLIGCGSSKLSKDFNEKEVKEAVENVISNINNKDSEALLNTSTVAMKEALTPEVLQGIYEAIGEGGEFKKIENISVGAETDKNSKEEYAVTVAKAKYDNKNFIYTITFTKQMKIAGLYFK